MPQGKSLLFILYTKITLTELVNGLVLLMLPIYFNALERSAQRTTEYTRISLTKLVNG